MKTIQLGSTGQEVINLSRALGFQHDKYTFDEELRVAVVQYQKRNNLISDGIVGMDTWFKIVLEDREKNHRSQAITDYDYRVFANVLEVDIPSLKAVKEVETGGRGGFNKDGSVSILFEAAVFYKELKNVGLDPEKYIKSHPGILARKWDRTLYKGGQAEWTRLKEAIEINEVAALKSASWGIFQTMGFNYEKAGCEDIFQFVNIMKRSEFWQFILGLQFMKNSGTLAYLRRHDWAGFAYRYNGPGYQANSYDTKLRNAYNKYNR